MDAGTRSSILEGGSGGDAMHERDAATGGSGGQRIASSGGSGGAGGSHPGGAGGKAGGSGGVGAGGAKGSSPDAGMPGSSGSCGAGAALQPDPGTVTKGKLGEWENVTPSGVSLNFSDFNNDNFGAQDVLADPVRPSDLYAFFCHQGVYKSVDYGLTWSKVNTGTNGDKIDSGKPWGEAINTDRCRDPNTPPTLYSLGSQSGFWRSRDGGVNWETFALPEDGKARTQDGYDVDVDPYDGRHLIVGFHEESGLAESTDGGETWHSVTLDAGMSSGVSWYVFFIDTGAAATTRKTWLMIAQATNGKDGTWRTADGGATWTRVESNEHLHGQTQIFQTQGRVYMAGVYGDQGWGVYRSTDFGATWKHIGPERAENGVFGTLKYVYAQSGGASSAGVDQSGAERALLSDDTQWSDWAVNVGNGPKRAAVTHDGSHSIIVGGNWVSGLVRYVEP